MLRAAIDAMCRQCLYDPKAAGLGHWRQQIEACTDTGCPLFPVRPRTRARKGSDVADTGAFPDSAADSDPGRQWSAGSGA